jgi:hypothetical protein
MYTVRSELQRTADAAALAGASAMYSPEATLGNQVYSLCPDPLVARQQARLYANRNPRGNTPLDVYLNASNAADGDIVIGELTVPWNQSESLNSFSDSPNTVFVRISMTDDHPNGPGSLFFARALGMDRFQMVASAAATVWYPALLPFATSEKNWQSLADGGAGDLLTHSDKSISFGIKPGAYGVPEIVMFPGNWDGSDEMPPGNFGIIQVGPAGDELTVLRGQIDKGPSQTDLDFHGGFLEGGQTIPGRTGIKSSAKHAFLGGRADGREFAGMLGEVRTLPIYETASGNGDNAVFRLSRFVIVRILAIKIDSRWRYQRMDTEGEEITAVLAQPVQELGKLVQTRLTR